jgi:hypothetical protein
MDLHVDFFIYNLGDGFIWFIQRSWEREKEGKERERERHREIESKIKVRNMLVAFLHTKPKWKFWYRKWCGWIYSCLALFDFQDIAMPCISCAVFWRRFRGRFSKMQSGWLIPSVTVTQVLFLWQLPLVFWLLHNMKRWIVSLLISVSKD